MVMCASSPDKVEILDPPGGAVAGDRIIFQGFPGTEPSSCDPTNRLIKVSLNSPVGEMKLWISLDTSPDMLKDPSSLEDLTDWLKTT